MSRFCKACNIKIDENNYLKDRANCKNIYYKKKRKNKNKNTLIPNQQHTSSGKEIFASHRLPKIDNFNNNNRTPLVAPIFLGNTFVILSRLPN